MKSIPILMPQMGQSIAEGTVVKWHKQVGEAVAVDELLVEVESDKIAFEVESPEAGVLKALLKNEGDTAEVGAAIGFLEAEGAGDAAAAAGPAGFLSREEDGGLAKLASAERHEIDVNALPEITRDWLSPSVARLAVLNSITMAELNALRGTGTRGRLTKNDLLLHLARRSTAPAQPPRPTAGPAPEALQALGKMVPMTAVRRTIADHMVQSIHTSAHVTMVHAVDTTHIVELRGQVKDDFLSRYGVKMTYTGVMIFVAARLLREFPYVNASVFGSNILLRNEVNIGCAVAMEDQSLVVPVIGNADGKSFPQIAQDLDRLVTLARRRELSRSDVEGGTFTISNFGTFGSLFGTPIINQPQVAILGMGAITKTLVPRGEACVTRDVMFLSLSFDHRVIDGAMGGNFLNRLQANVESLTADSLDVASL